MVKRLVSSRVVICSGHFKSGCHIVSCHMSYFRVLFSEVLSPGVLSSEVLSPGVLSSEVQSVVICMASARALFLL